MNDRTLLADIKTSFDSYDGYGEAMGWLFAIAGELHWRDRSSLAISGWLVDVKYSPGQSGTDPRDHDDHRTLDCKEATDSDLLWAGMVLDRYTDLLSANDLDY